jgi:LL-diaminopimelate aminotransferase
MRRSDRLAKIPPYLFAEIDKKKEAAIKKGVDVISLGIGDPDVPTPGYIIDSFFDAVKNQKNHRYPAYEGSMAFRQAVADWYKERYKVDIDPETEVMALIGSKEGIAHIFLAYIDPGDYALVPDPAYPVYKTGTLFAGGIPYPMPLTEENNFLPQFDAIDKDIVRNSKLLFLNYPNNPTAAVAEMSEFEKAVNFARENDMILCHDSAYSDITFDGYNAASPLQIKGAKDICIEFGSLSKPFNMTGWRIGYAVGGAEIIKNLGVIKTNIDSGQFNAIQDAAIHALKAPKDQIKKMVEIYKERRDVAVAELNAIGISVEAPKGTFYLWPKVPKGYTSTEFAGKLLDEAGVIVTPGNAYGDFGEGYFRIALTVDVERMKEAFERIKKSVKL